MIHEIVNPDKYSGVPIPSLPGFTSLIKGFRRGEMTVLTGPVSCLSTTCIAQQHNNSLTILAPAKLPQTDGLRQDDIPRPSELGPRRAGHLCPMGELRNQEYSIDAKAIATVHEGRASSRTC